MKFLVNTALAAFLATSLTGCIVIGGEHGWDDNDWEKQQRENRQMIGQLELGNDRERVISRMGAPSFSEAFTKDNDEYRVLYYRTQRERSDGETTKDETTPLVFKNNVLVGWGNEALKALKI